MQRKKSPIHFDLNNKEIISHNASPQGEKISCLANSLAIPYPPGLNSFYPSPL